MNLRIDDLARVPRRSRILLLALSVLLATPASALAGTPTVGASRGSFPDIPGQEIGWRWAASGYPTWLTTAAAAGLAAYPDARANNSGGPRPVYLAGSSATVHYSATSSSPCNSLVNLLWLQCASNWTTTAFRIHVRDFDGAPYGDWRWWEKTRSCLTSSGRTASGCWRVPRAMIHEAGHALAHFGHDTQTEAETVMRSVSPEVGMTGGDRSTLQRCDQAALQLMWDLADLAQPYGDCFDGIASHGVTGLVTRLTVSGSSFAACLGATVPVEGRLAVAPYTDYRRLSNNPLAVRTVWFDRKPHSSTTWTPSAEGTLALRDLTGPNWSRAFWSPTGSAGTWDYRARFLGAQGLDPSSSPVFSIAWRIC
jgi:hypothetical protein